jgi:hypothetical protein
MIESTTIMRAAVNKETIKVLWLRFRSLLRDDAFHALLP